MLTTRQLERSAHVPRVNISVPGIPRPLANYTPAARAGHLVFAAGQLASDFNEGVAAEARIDPVFPYYGSAIKKQTRYVLENLAQTFKAAGTSLSHVVKAQVFHTDLANFSGFDEVWQDFFPAPPPRTTIGTTGLLVPRHPRRDRPDRHRADGRRPRDPVGRPAASGELLRGCRGRRSRLCRRPARQ